jgi:hypothetical protein
MTETEDAFQNQKKLRKAELIMPPNRLKEKVGHGGIDETVLMKAQELMENNSIEFQPIAAMLIDVLSEAISDAKAGHISGEEAIEEMLYPAMQLKAQGTMFHYPLVSDISNTLVSFLETVGNTDKDVLDVVLAHKMSINAVLSSQIKGDGGKVGRELREALLGACARYYKAKKH